MQPPKIYFRFLFYTPKKRIYIKKKYTFLMTIYETNTKNNLKLSNKFNVIYSCTPIVRI